MPDTDDKITIQSITSPGHTERVNRAKYMAMREALIAILPTETHPASPSPKPRRRSCPICPTNFSPPAPRPDGG